MIDGLEVMRKIGACPICKLPLAVAQGEACVCSGCQRSFSWTGHTWDFVLPLNDRRGSKWDVWEHLQSNGMRGYEEDPIHNLSVGEREDCSQFKEFCNYSGVVLDVGCGPQKWPAYFGAESKGVTYVGVDPLLGDGNASFLKLKALGEFLPFKDGAFDRVVFATSLDHFIDPVPALREASRVCSRDGNISIWIGEKREGAPKPASSPKWYEELSTPKGAEDFFHYKRMGKTEAEHAIASAGLKLVETEVHAVDAYRSHIFYRVHRVG